MPLTTISELGRRRANADAVAATNLGPRAGAWILCVCDGVGLDAGAAECARGVRDSAVSAARRFRHRRTRRRLADPQAALTALRQRVSSTLPATGGGASTLALAVKHGRELFVLWAGDSRVYALDAAGRLEQLTQDHCDEEDRLVRFVHGDGNVRGGGLAARVSGADVAAVIATTDGLHDACTHEELERLVGHLVLQRIQAPSAISSVVLGFLGSNVSDNVSLAMWTRAGAGAGRSGGG